MKENLKLSAKKYLGKIEQIPPMYSAIKVNGKKLYEYARKGIEVKVPSRSVEIKESKILKVEPPYFDFYAHVSKGTYIRKLAEDISKEAGTDGHVSALCRTFIGPFKLIECIELDEVTEEKLMPIDEVKQMIADRI